MLILYKIVAIFHFCIMANANFPFILIQGKEETQTLGRVNNLEFYCRVIFL